MINGKMIGRGGKRQCCPSQSEKLPGREKDNKNPDNPVNPCLKLKKVAL